MQLTKIIIFFLSLICCSCNAQKIDSVIKSESFPKSWVGYYEGELMIFGVDSIKQVVTMGLNIRSISDSTYTWTISYLLDKKDERKYELQVIDKQKGIYQIDEKNGILLEANFFNEHLISRFGVNKSLLDISYSKIGNQIHFMVISGNRDGVLKEIEEDSIPEIFGYQVFSFQKAILQKKTLSNLNPTR